MSRAQQNLMSVNELAASAIFTPTGLRWQFPTLDEACRHLRRYEKLLAHWGAVLGAHDVQIIAAGEELPTITPRASNVKTELSPIVATPSFSNDDDVLVAQQWLNRPLLDAILDIRQNPGIVGLVSWETQKQVVLSKGCEVLTLGDRLRDCLKYSRHDYWMQADLDAYLNRCRQELNGDGSNVIENRYTFFNPDYPQQDWTRAVTQARFVDAGELGLFQLVRNVDYEKIPAPVKL
jgi:hypothetical protein